MTIRNTTLDDLAGVIGFSATLRLAAWYGDANNLYVPTQAEEGHVLVSLIGMAATRRLCDAWGSEHLAIPRLRDHEDDVRRHRIGRMLEMGFSTAEIARHERLGERRVQQICRDLEVAGLIRVVGPAKPKRGRPRDTMRSAKAAGENAPGKTPVQKHPGQNSQQKGPSAIARGEPAEQGGAT